MSDSELSEPSSANSPPDLELENSLREAVAEIFKSEDGTAITVNGVRKAAEEFLGLEPGFFDGHPTWKAESKRIIKDEHVEQARQEAAAPTSSAPQFQDHQTMAKSLEAKPAVKRRSPEEGNEGPAKRRKKVKATSVAEQSEDLSLPLSDLDEESSKPKAKRKSKSKPPAKTPVAKLPAPKSKTKSLENAKKSRQTEVDKSQCANAASVGKNVKIGQDAEGELSDVPDEVSAAEQRSLDQENPAPKPDDSGSELSVLLDEGPKPERKRKRVDTSERRTKNKSSIKVKADVEADPDDAEIKRLQGWLVKCGIRKLWGKELKPFDTPKAKIKHLKEMLSDAGMTGRYSIEKANQIKEARELAADIEAVQEGAERWGKEDNDSDSNDNRKSKRRVVRGAKNYAFLSSDGEETD